MEFVNCTVLKKARSLVEHFPKSDIYVMAGQTCPCRCSFFSRRQTETESAQTAALVLINVTIVLIVALLDVNW